MREPRNILDVYALINEPIASSQEFVKTILHNDLLPTCELGDSQDADKESFEFIELFDILINMLH